MLERQFLDAASTAPNSRALDDIARLTWRAHAEGQIDDAAAMAASEAVQTRRRAFSQGRGFARPTPRTAALAARRPPRSPDRRASIERRRRQAASGAMPPALACQFTTGEQAVLAVVAREVQGRQVCVWPIDRIAARAGVSRSTVKNAIRLARRFGWLQVLERRVPGRKSLPNVIHIIDRAWLAWLRLGAGSIGVRKMTSTDTGSFPGTVKSAQPAQKGIREGAGRASVPSGTPRVQADG